LRAPAGGQGDGRHGGADDGRGPARQARLRMDGEPRPAAGRPAGAVHAQDGGGGRVRTKRLVELAKTIRSKNAGVDQITFDVIFADRESYELVKRSGALTADVVSRLYAIPRERITRSSSTVRRRPASSPTAATGRAAAP